MFNVYPMVLLVAHNVESIGGKRLREFGTSLLDLLRELSLRRHRSFDPLLGDSLGALKRSVLESKRLRVRVEGYLTCIHGLEAGGHLRALSELGSVESVGIGSGRVDWFIALILVLDQAFNGVSDFFIFGVDSRLLFESEHV